jgi:glyoxylase I family protein
MPRIIGIGGVFLYAHNAENLADWYTRHFGFKLKRLTKDNQSVTFYQERDYRDLDNPDQKVHIVFAIVPAKEALSVLHNQFMLNYRVDDLDAFVQQLNMDGVLTEPVQTGDVVGGKGKFTHLHDPEGNLIELWQQVEA